MVAFVGRWREKVRKRDHDSKDRRGKARGDGQARGVRGRGGRMVEERI